MKKKTLLFINCNQKILNKAKDLIKKHKNFLLLSIKKKDNILLKLEKIRPDAVFCEYKDTFFDFFNIFNVSFSEKLLYKKDFFTFVDKSNIHNVLRLEQNQIYQYDKSQFENIFYHYISKSRSFSK